MIEGFNITLHQRLLEFPMNGVGDWHGEYGDTRSPSLHTSLLRHRECVS